MATPPTTTAGTTSTATPQYAAGTVPDPKNADQMAPVKDVSEEVRRLGASQTGDLPIVPVSDDPIDECIRVWEVQNVYNSILSRDTEAFNYLHARLAILAQDLKKVMSTPAPGRKG